MKDYEFEFLDFLVRKYSLNKKEVNELKDIMRKNYISEERLLYLLERYKNKEE